ncbi:hypothetical protein QR685DRAFT_537360 [Neurospora intermedia]|uniref:Uncharacterized protein n=1 Tax=Neurospora intermedia TaxID=5142 RepID=A0ABR3D082_NEUIN
MTSVIEPLEVCNRMECFLGCSSFLAAISALAETPVRLWFLLEVGFRPQLLGAKTRMRRAVS